MSLNWGLSYVFLVKLWFWHHFQMFSWITADRTKYKADILALISPFIQQPKKTHYSGKKQTTSLKSGLQREPKWEETKVDRGWGIDPKGPGKDWPRGKKHFRKAGGKLICLIFCPRTTLRLELNSRNWMHYCASPLPTFPTFAPLLLFTVVYWPFLSFVSHHFYKKKMSHQSDLSGKPHYHPQWVTKTVWSRSRLQRCSQTNQPSTAQ